LLGPPFFGLPFVQLFDLSIQLFLFYLNKIYSGFSPSVLAVQKKEETRKRTLANEEVKGATAALSLQ
jgi:hypothetical protein